MVFISLISYGQTKYYSVIGSSTAAGMGASTADSSWVKRFTHYYQNLGLTIIEHNTAVPGRNCYQGMPSSYTPPPTGIIQLMVKILPMLFLLILIRMW